jgi:GH24 family phage-related lysozyme (muramidase)
MITSPEGRKFIEQWEGLFLHAYDDGGGTLTIGYGHTTKAGPPRVYPGMTITQQQADAILSSDLRSVELEVEHLVRVALAQNQFDALVSFDFNTGGLHVSSVLRAVNAQDWSAVPADLILWDHMRVHGVEVADKGLFRRRKAEGQLFSTV